ncbi:oligosaccharide flippase family protein [bacterium]|nr:oligosaccharide flippase family protein [bacterium]
MIHHFKKLGAHTVVYGLGDMVVKAIAFFLIPLYTRHLSTESYGVYSLLQTIQMMLVLLLGLGFQSAIFKVYHEAKDDDERDRTISTALITYVIWAVPVTLLLMALSGRLALLIFNDAAVALYLRLIFGAVFFDLFRILILSLLRAWERPVHFAVVNIVHFSVLVTLNIINVAVRERGIQGIMESQLITSMGIFSVLGIMILKRIRIGFSGALLKQLLHFGLPLVPSGIAAWSLSMTGQYFLHFYQSDHDVGLYGLGWRFGMIVNMLLVHPFRTAWLPFLFSVKNEPNARRIYSLSFTYFLAAGMLLFLILSVLSREIVTLFTTADYLEAYRVIPWIAAAYLFYGLFNTVDVGVLLTGKTKYYAMITALTAGVQILVYLLIVPRFGVIGTAAGTTFSYSLLMIFMIIVAGKLYPIRYEIDRVLKIVLIGSLIFVVSGRIQIESIVLRIALKTLLIIGYPFLLWCTRFYTVQELRAIKNWKQFRMKRKTDRDISR